MAQITRERTIGRLVSTGDEVLQETEPGTSDCPTVRMGYFERGLEDSDFFQFKDQVADTLLHCFFHSADCRQAKPSKYLQARGL
jgi:hypothetical protein